MQRHMIRLSALLALLFGVLGTTVSAQAQETVVCFDDVPGIGSCITDRFLEYWSQNGGLPVFGYPLTPAFEQQTPEGAFLVQYFERQRFELHPEKKRPYDVLLGRLGDEMLRRQGRDWRNEPANPANPNCWIVPQTNRSLCQPFAQYWSDHYLLDLAPKAGELDGSLALWGWPLTDTKSERNGDGATVQTQWFERARFEYHPNNPRQYQVLLGRLGAEALNGTPATIGGSSNGHSAAKRQIVIGSERDGSATTVTYTDKTRLVCSDNRPAPASMLDRPELRLFAEGTFNAQGVLAASSITMVCG